MTVFGLALSSRASLAWREKALLLFFAAAMLAMLAYLIVFEDTAMNRVVSIALLLPVSGVLFLLSRRPVASLAGGIAMLLVLAVLSRAKYDITTVSISVFDMSLLDPGALWFALNQEQFFWHIALAAAFFVVLAGLMLLDSPVPLRIWQRIGLVGVALAVFFGLALAQDKDERGLLAMNGEIGQISYFAKSLTHLPAFFQSSGFLKHGPLDDPALPPKGAVFGQTACKVEQKPPHIIIISDESAIDTTVQPGVEPDSMLAPFFKSYDGAKRRMIAESYGGATWLAETSVLTGLAARSFGGFVPLVPRIIGAGKVRYNLPSWLEECGYSTLSLYPADGRFAGAAVMHQSFGVDRFEDQVSMAIKDERQRDRFYYEKIIDALEKQPSQPLFGFVWTTSNHFAWNFKFAPEIEVNGLPPSSTQSIAEYRRRQRISQMDMEWFKQELAKRFPAERFVILRYGDHMPYMGMRMAAPEMTKEAAQERIAAFDPRFYTTYYAYDLINMTAAATPSAVDPLAVAYLGGELMRIAGLPLNPPMAYQQDMMKRCKGQFADCEGGIEMNRFNAWMIREGHVSGL
jgi:phosphoglycerol transferase MdoB-like AlkP superfamily enzyme